MNFDVHSFRHAGVILNEPEFIDQPSGLLEIIGLKIHKTFHIEHEQIAPRKKLEILF